MLPEDFRVVESQPKSPFCLDSLNGGTTRNLVPQKHRFTIAPNPKAIFQV